MYKTKLRDHRGVYVTFCAPSVLESIRIAIGFNAVSYAITKRLTGNLVYRVACGD